MDGETVACVGCWIPRTLSHGSIEVKIVRQGDQLLRK